MIIQMHKQILRYMGKQTMSEKTMNEVIKHETVLEIIKGNDKEQDTKITLPMLLKKLEEYEKGKMLLLQQEEHDIVLNYIKQQQEITKALTPPTAEEVCEALGKYYKLEEFESVLYDENFSYFVLNRLKEKGNIVFLIKNKIKINDYLPPHLITLIGRFYESVVK